MVERASRDKKARKSEVKTQPAIEYLSTYSVALLFLVIVIAIVSLLLFTHGTPPVTSTCYISAQLNCIQLVIANNDIQSTAVVIFTNNLNVPISFPHNSFLVKPTGSQTTYSGQCYPANSIVGSTIICNATLSGYFPSVGSQVEPAFTLEYVQCSDGVCASYNVSGEGVVYVSPSPTTYPVTLLTLPAGGYVSVNGNAYPSNTLVYLVAGKTYSVYPSGPAGFTQFEGWLATGGVSVANSMVAATTASATSSGTLTAVFQCFTLEVKDNPTSSGTEAPSPSSSGDCAGFNYGTTDNHFYYYLPTTAVSVSQSPDFNYWFSSWTGSSGSAGTSYTGSSDVADVAINSNVVETANYAECYLLTVDTSGSGSTSIPSPSSSTGCNTGYYLPGTMVSLTASPSSSWELGSVTNDWTGSCSTGCSGYVTGGSSTITVIMNGPITETANFNPMVTISYNYATASDYWQVCAGLTSTNYCNSQGQSSYSFYEPYESTLSAICTAQNFGSSQWRFDDWGGAASGNGCSNTAIDVYLSGPVTIYANYWPPQTVTVYLNPSAASTDWEVCAGLGGNDGCNSQYQGSFSFTEPYGSTLNYVCTASNYGSGLYAFSSYSGSYSSSSQCNSGAGVSVTGPISITANYNQCYYLSIYAPDSQINSISPSSSPGCPTYYYYYGTTVTVDTTTDSGYTLITWYCYVNGVQETNGECYAGTAADMSTGIWGNTNEDISYGSAPPPPPGYYCGNYGNGGSPSSTCNGVFYDYCAGLSTSYIYESSAIDDCGSPVALCHLCGATDAYGNVEGDSGNANGDNEGGECSAWAC